MRTWAALLLVTWCLVEGRRRTLPLKERPHPPHGDNLEEEEISCERRSKCANSSSTLPFHARNCFCDDSCRMYGDCCQDHPSIRTPPPGRGTAWGTPGPDPALRRSTSCRRNEDIDRIHEIHIVDHCPRSYQDAAVRRDCENELAPEVFNRLPVTGRTSGVLYRNVYCAVCSGDREFVFWELAYRCNGMSDVTAIDSAEQFRRLAPRCTLQLLPPVGMEPRKCKSSIDECEKKWKDERVAKKCRSYTSYVYLDLETYKNRHCAICNSVKNSSLTCYDQRTPNWERTWDDSRQTQTRYLVYDVNTRRAFVRSGKSSAGNQGNVNVGTARELGSNCSRGSVYDILTDKCRCTMEKCLEMPTTKISTTTVSVSARGVTRQPSRGVTTTAAKIRGRKTTAAATKRYARTTVATTKTTKMNRPSKDVVPTAGPLHTQSSTGFSSSTRESTSTRASTVATTSISTIAASANTVTRSSAGTNAIKYKATASSTFNRFPSDIVTFTDKINATSATSKLLSTATIDFNSFAEKTAKTETVEFEVDRGSLLTENSEPSIRLSSSVTKGSSQMIMTTSGVVTPVTTTGVDDRQDQRDFDDYLSSEEAKEKKNGIPARWRNCSDVRAMFVYDRLQSLATFVSTLLSMVCLLITFVAILLLPLLQTMRGKILLSLSLCLFVAQLLYLLALPSNRPLPHHGGVSCYWLGCALHYFVLAGFFWISALAFDTSWSVIGDRLDSAAGSCRYVAYSLYAWLTPAAIVIAGVVTDFIGADRVLIRPCYGQGACFIAGTFSLLLIFAAPAGVLVLVSVFVYFLAASNACFEEASAAKSKRPKSGTSRGGRLLALCLSLTFLAAVTWVAAFVAAFLGPRATWWAFVAVSPSQGIFMFVAFICRRSTLEQLRGRRGRMGEGQRQNGASAATQWSYRRDFSAAPMADQRDLGISNPDFLQNETYM